MSLAYDDFYKRLKGYKQELLQLKQVKRASTNSKYYIYKASGDNLYFTWLVTYKDGDQPIIAEVLSYYDTSMSAPSGNQQYIFSFAQASAELTVLSTREVQSITGIA